MSWQVAVLWGVFILRVIGLLVKPLTTIAEQTQTGEDFEKNKPRMMQAAVSGWCFGAVLTIAFGLALWSLPAA